MNEVSRYLVEEAINRIILYDMNKKADSYNRVVKEEKNKLNKEETKVLDKALGYIEKRVNYTREHKVLINEHNYSEVEENYIFNLEYVEKLSQYIAENIKDKIEVVRSYVSNEKMYTYGSGEGKTEYESVVKLIYYVPNLESSIKTRKVISFLVEYKAEKYQGEGEILEETIKVYEGKEEKEVKLIPYK